MSNEQSEERSGSGRWLVVGVAVLGCVFSVAAGLEAMPRLMPHPPEFTRDLQLTGWLVSEELCARLRALPLNLRYLLFAAAVLLSAFACSWSYDLFEVLLPAGAGPVLRPLFVIAAMVVVGFFALRVRLWLFPHAGRVDWMMNGVAFCCGLLAGLATSLRSR
jgi:hypothetical protein